MSSVRVAVCIATFRRPEGLRRLVRSLDALTVPQHLAEVAVIVADNDPRGSGLTALRHLDVETVTVRAVHEPQPGIPLARNAALREAHGVDYLAFVDDDEVVDPLWLDELLGVARRYAADIVTGPVLPELPPETPAWIAQGRFFERPRFATGTQRPYAATNNALVHCSVFETVGHFEERLAFTGGSDREFFDRARQAGFAIVWADGALVREYVPRERVRVWWILRRSYRLGNNIPVRMRLRAAPWWCYVGEGAFALARVAWGLAIGATALLRGRWALVKGLRSITAALGTLAGLAGHRFAEYKTVNTNDRRRP